MMKGFVLFIVVVTALFFYLSTNSEIDATEGQRTGPQEKERGMCSLEQTHVWNSPSGRWQSEYSSALGAMGLDQGSASACVFRHREKHIVVSVRGDDFTAAGPKSALDWVEATLKDKYKHNMTNDCVTQICSHSLSRQINCKQLRILINHN